MSFAFLGTNVLFNTKWDGLALSQKLDLDVDVGGYLKVWNLWFGNQDYDMDAVWELFHLREKTFIQIEHLKFPPTEQYVREICLKWCTTNSSVVPM